MIRIEEGENETNDTERLENEVNEKCGQNTMAQWSRERERKSSGDRWGGTMGRPGCELCHHQFF